MENSKRFVSFVGIKELLKKSRHQRSICNKERKLTSLTVVLQIIFLHGANEITAKSYKIQMVPRKGVYYNSFGAINHRFFTVRPSPGNGKKKGTNTQLFLLFFLKQELIILSLEDAFSDIASLELGN